MTTAETFDAIIGAFTAIATLAAVVVAVLGIRHEAHARRRAEARRRRRRGGPDPGRARA
ncbi:hypothetical protein CHO01_39230 [Cellulomonas hominis]|uniref:Uncharacterized protein n=1 Tax=Cellulomonas hominis TaxID=156981 RepID=A0A511FK78_9CELL|nr:hypothetical protein [Cellulomonas hominis]MBB5474795.1 hypothetical protein [Cellulomonas hominis]NKY05800.1 hypothetical protein [Cellulomonas hominis]GEL48807.1 hypothetical protein CHO01_39230 [Cellulomonas hominis]